VERSVRLKEKIEGGREKKGHFYIMAFLLRGRHELKGVGCFENRS